jgi:polyhydroxybutyrate depolymerase
MPARLALFGLLLILHVPAAAAEPCGRPDAECRVQQGFYRLALPEATEGPVPALVFLHGWGQSAATVMRNEAMLAALAARGYALIAPEGIPRPTHENRDWSVRDGDPTARDDVAFLTEVLDDAARHGVARDRVLMAGFSRGGSMVWDVACHAPGTARAYSPVAGAFWEPMPDGCAGPVDLFHTHGWSDRVVPL